MKIERNKFYIVRADRAGVFFGKVKEVAPDMSSVTMTETRKIWKWSGASAVEQLAADGSKDPKNCKLTVKISEMTIKDPVQVIPCSEAAAGILSEIKEWKV